MIIGSVGYPDLRDHSAGLVVAERLRRAPPRGDVVVEDLSYNPVAVVQRLQDERENAFGRAVFISAVSRGGRQPGSLAAYRWDGVLPDPDEVHRAVCDAVTGVIFVDNTLVVARQFGALPAEVFVVEIEPLVHEFGHALSPAVAAAIEPAAALVGRIATDDDFAARMEAAPLGGGRTAGARAR